MSNNKKIDINGILDRLKNNNVPDYAFTKPLDELSEQDAPELLDLLNLSIWFRRSKLNIATTEFLVCSSYCLPLQNNISLMVLNIENHFIREDERFLREQKNLLSEASSIKTDVKSKKKKLAVGNIKKEFV